MLFAGLACAGTARGQCEDKVSTADMTQCYDAELKKADAELNRTYQEALGKLKGDNVTRLRTAQRAWVAYRDAQCQAAYKMFEGGTIAPLAFTQCKTKLTQSRTKEIRQTYFPEEPPQK